MRPPPRILAPACGLLLLAGGSSAAPPPAPRAPSRVVERLEPPLQGFYSKRLLTHGVPILAHADVADEALIGAAEKLELLLRHHPPEVAARLRASGTAMRLVGREQRNSDLPELRGKGALKTTELGPRGDRVAGARRRELTLDEVDGMAGEVSFCHEEDAALPTASGLSACLHEWAHLLHRRSFGGRTALLIETRYREALLEGRWTHEYAATNAFEFFAVLSEIFHVSGHSTPGTRDAAWLQAYDPQSFELLEGIYSGGAGLPSLLEAEGEGTWGPRVRAADEARTAGHPEALRAAARELLDWAREIWNTTGWHSGRSPDCPALRLAVAAHGYLHDAALLEGDHAAALRAARRRLRWQLRNLRLPGNLELSPVSRRVEQARTGAAAVAAQLRVIEGDSAADAFLERVEEHLATLAEAAAREGFGAPEATYPG